MKKRGKKLGITAGAKPAASARARVASTELVSVPSDGADVATMLAELPRQQRLSVALFYVDGMSVAEVADALSISVGAVKFHLHQGRERLRGTFLNGEPHE